MMAKTRESNNHSFANSTELLPLLPPELRTIVSDYLDTSIKIPSKEMTEVYSNKLGNPTLFGFTVTTLLKQLAKRAANLLLHGGEKEVEELFEILQYNPDISMMKTEGIDSNGNIVPGTLVEIAAKAGDVTAIQAAQPQPILHIKQRGLVEQMISLRGKCLSLEEIATLRNMIDSHKDARARKITLAMIQFGDEILLSDTDEQYQSALKTFQDALKPSTIALNFVFDLLILSDAADWFQQNQARFNDQQTLQFWRDGFNELLNHLSSRDKQLLQAGIFSDDEIIEYRFELMRHGWGLQEMKMPALSKGLIYYSMGNHYYLQNVDGEIHQGKIHREELEDYGSLSIHALRFQIGQGDWKKTILKLIAKNGHVQLEPKTTLARCLNQDILPPDNNLLLLFRPQERFRIEKRGGLVECLRSNCGDIAYNFSRHRSNKYYNYQHALDQAKLATEKQEKQNRCCVG